MSNLRNSALQYAHQNHSRFLDELKDFLTIPSISTELAHSSDIRRAAEWVAGRLRALKMRNVEVTSNTHPVVYGEALNAGHQVPTVLIYGHYDVQPVEPLNLWDTGPFEPAFRGENLHARGASDMKGQLTATLNAVESSMLSENQPVNFRFLIEGEEEIGSPHLAEYIAENKGRLACDFSLNPDSGMAAPDLPSITYALRGLCFFDLRVEGPDHDLHSGTFGGVVHNPAQALCELIAGMHDANGGVTLPGFYDKVRPLDNVEREELARLPFNESFYLTQTGARTLWGEKEYAAAERIGARPTLEINGLQSGFTAPGSKTVLPAYASAKVSMRLVPDQDPNEVEHQLRSYLESQAPRSVRWDLKRLYGYPASVIDRSLRPVKAMSGALEAVWGRPPLFKREGISVPVVAYLEQILGVKSVLTGFSLPDDRAHSPNEKLHLPTWHRGIDAFIHFFYNLKGQDLS